MSSSSLDDEPPGHAQLSQYPEPMLSPRPKEVECGIDQIKVRVGNRSFKIDRAMIRRRPESMLYVLVRFYDRQGEPLSGLRKRKRRNSSVHARFRERNPDIFADVLRWYCGSTLQITPGFSLETVLGEWDFWGIDPVQDASEMHAAVLPQSWNTHDLMRERLAQIAASITALATNNPAVLHDGHVLVFPTKGWFTFVDISQACSDDILAMSHAFVRQLLVFQLCRHHVQAKFVPHPPTCQRLPGQKCWTYTILDHWLGDNGPEMEDRMRRALVNMTSTECARCTTACKDGSGCWRSEERTKRATMCMDIQMAPCAWIS